MKKELTVLYHGNVIRVSDLIRLADAYESSYRALMGKPRLKDNLNLSSMIIKDYTKQIEKAGYDPLFSETLNECIEDLDQLIVNINMIDMEVK